MTPDFAASFVFRPTRPDPTRHLRNPSPRPCESPDNAGRVTLRQRRVAFAACACSRSETAGDWDRLGVPERKGGQTEADRLGKGEIMWGIERAKGADADPLTLSPTAPLGRSFFNMELANPTNLLDARTAHSRKASRTC